MYKFGRPRDEPLGSFQIAFDALREHASKRNMDLDADIRDVVGEETGEPDWTTYGLAVLLVNVVHPDFHATMRRHLPDEGMFEFLESVGRGYADGYEMEDLIKDADPVIMSVFSLGKGIEEEKEDDEGNDGDGKERGSGRVEEERKEDHGNNDGTGVTGTRPHETDDDGFLKVDDGGEESSEDRS